jgi:hypothetical protein
MRSFPSDTDTVQRLEGIFRKASPQQEFTFQKLFQLVRPSSPQALVLILDELVHEGLIRRLFRVESPQSGGGLRDYETLEEIPETLHDWRTDEVTEVTPENVRPIFKAS